MRILLAPTPSSVITITEENTMHANHRPTPLCGPVPDGMMRLTIDLPKDVFDELEESAWRHGVSLGHLLDAALLFAAGHR